MKRLLYIPILFLLDITLTFASESFELKTGETISSLLYERLNIRPLTQEKIQRVLNFNNLSDDETRNLRAGTPIKVPSDILVSKTEDVISTAQAAPENAMPMDQNFLENWDVSYPIGAGLVFERLRSVGGKIENVFITALRPTLFIEPTLQNGKNTFRSRMEVSLLTLQSDSERNGSGNFLMGEVFVSYLREVDTVRVGGKLRNNRQLLVLPFSSSYEVFAKWLWGVGPIMEWKDWKLQHLFIPDQGEGKRETKSNFETSVFYDFNINELNLRSRVFYGNTSIEAVDSREFGIGIEYFF